MLTSIDQLSNTVYRLTLYPENGFIGFNHFLILDENPTLIHMGHKKTFETLLGLVNKLVDPSNLRYLAFSHHEADESGALAQWLTIAPNAEVCVGKICASSIQDEMEGVPKVLKHGETINLGSENLILLETPHFPHNWDACLFLTDKSQVVFGSDLGTQPGNRSAFTDIDPSEEIVALQRQVGYMSYGPNFDKAVAILQGYEVNTLAAMHGSALSKAQYNNLLGLLTLENVAALRANTTPEVCF